MTKLIDQYFFDAMEKRFGTDKPLEIAAFQGTVVGPGVQARDVQRHDDVAAHGNITEVYTHEIDLNDPIQDAIKTTKLVMSQAPGLAGIWETADLCVAAHAQALTSLEIPVEKRPVVIGFYSTQQSREAMKTGEVAGCVDLDLGQQGYFCIDQAVEYWARRNSHCTRSDGLAPAVLD